MATNAHRSAGDRSRGASRRWGGDGADIETGGLGEQRALPFARRAIEALNKIEQFTDQPRRGDVIYPFAAQAAQAINRFDTPQARELAEQLSEIAQRQRLSRPTDLHKINQIDRLLRSDQYQQALALSRRVRAENPTAYREVMFDNFETIANLHLHRLDAASASLQRILDAANESHHMRPQIELAAEEIGVALEATRAAWAGRSQRLAEQEAALRALT